MDNKEKQQQINIELNEETAKGTYSNLSVITHSNHEFVVDFVQMMPGVPKAKVNSRIIMTPQSAKRLLKALSENVNRFEQLHGKIKDDEQGPGGSQMPPFNFGTPATEA
jgi:hypothetical protein